MTRSYLHAAAAAALALSGFGTAFSALAQSSANPPAGFAAINYNRCDSGYDGWGLHAWKDGGIPLPGVEWQKPLQPTGKSEFGVFWNLKLDDFAKAKVNYIIHKGDSKEQGGRDMGFDAGATQEIWVNSGDRKIYTSLDEAKAARVAKPCPA